MMKKRPELLLINPWIYDFTAYDFWSKPLGLLFIASLLRQKGFRINFIDCMDRYDTDLLEIQNLILPENHVDGMGPYYKVNTPKPEILRHIPRNYSRYGITEEIFTEKLKRMKKPDVILVTSVMSYWYPGVFKAIELVKKFYPDCPVILGGIYATLCFRHAVNFSGADFVIRNEQIDHLFELLEHLIKVSLGTTSYKLPGLECFPIPAWDLYHNLDYICLLTTMGCPFQCSYCASNLLSPVFKYRNHEQILAEIIRWVRDKGIRNFVFYDDALLVNAEQHFIPLMELIKRQRLNIHFHTPNAVHAGLISQPIARLMVENGFKRIWLGFETSDVALQRKTGGKIDNLGFSKAIHILKQEGFPPELIRAYVLMGLPGQSLQSVIDSVEFVIDTGIKPYLAKFSPIPGTKIWAEAIKEYGWEEPVDPLLHNDALMPYYAPSINHKQYQQIKMVIQNSGL